jgi:hypothetical protein
MPLNLVRWPLPGTATIAVLDRIEILGKTLPLNSPIDTGTVLDVEKRKQPGSDYSSYVSHGIDSMPITIELLLFKDLTSGRDWYSDYETIRPQLVPRFLSQRNAVPVYHPFLNLEGINSIIFTERSIPKRSHGNFFVVTLRGYNPKTLRIGNGRITQDTNLTSRASTINAQGQSKAVGINNQNTQRPTAKQAPSNVRGPAVNQAGQARRPTGG